MVSVGSGSLSEAAGAVAQARALAGAAATTVSPVLDPAAAWTGSAATAYAHEANAVSAAIRAAAAALDVLSAASSSTVDVGSGGGGSVLSSTAGLVAAGVLVTPLLVGTASTGSAASGAASVAGSAWEVASEASSVALSEATSTSSSAATPLSGWDVAEEMQWFGHGRPFGEAAGEGIGTVVASESTASGGIGTTLVSSSGIMSAESLVAQSLTELGIEVPEVSAEAVAGVQEWLDSLAAVETQSGAGASSAPITLEQLGRLTDLVTEGEPVEAVAAELGFAGMTATDLEAVGGIFAETAEASGFGTGFDSVVEQGLIRADQLGLTGGPDAFGGTDFTFRDLVGLNILSDADVSAETTLADAGLSWLPPNALSEANQAVNEVVGPYVSRFHGPEALSLPEVMQSVNTAISRGVPAEQALADARVAISPAEYEGLMSALRTRLAQIAHPW